MSNVSRKGAFKWLQENNFKGLIWYYKEYFARMAYFALAIIGSRAHAEEITMQVFVNFWKKRKSIKTIDHVNIFLFYVTRDECYKLLSVHNLIMVKPHRYWTTEVSTVLKIMEAIESTKNKEVMKNMFTMEFKNENVFFGTPVARLYEPKYKLTRYLVKTKRNNIRSKAIGI